MTWCPWHEADNGEDNRICLRCLNAHLAHKPKPRRVLVYCPVCQSHQCVVPKLCVDTEMREWQRQLNERRTG